MSADTIALVPAAGLVPPARGATQDFPAAADGFLPAWPLRSHLELGALPTAPSCARSHARLIAAEWGLGDLAETAGLLVTELATNAVQASAGLRGCDYLGVWSPGLPPIRIWLSSDRDQLLIQVWDASHRMPAREDPEPDAESGRGLQLVEAICSRWGAFVPEGSGGKIVWALLCAGDR